MIISVLQSALCLVSGGDILLEIVSVYERSKHTHISMVISCAVSLVQACRGGRFDYGVETEGTDAPEPASEAEEEKMKEIMEQQVSPYTIPPSLPPSFLSLFLSLPLPLMHHSQ